MASLAKSTVLFGVILGSIILLMLIGVAISVSVSDDFAQSSDANCNIAVIPLVGEITTFDGGNQTAYEFENLYGQVSADQVVQRIVDAEASGDIDGILLRVDSSGGGPVGGEMIADALRNSKLPSVALIRSVGASAAYLAATGADSILTSAFSDVGSIGVNMSYLEYSQQNEEEGISYVQLTSAAYKDYGSANRPMTDEERALFLRDLEIYHQVFVNEVADNRHLAVEKVEEYADGSSVPARMALDMGLVDGIGDETQARTWFAEQLGTNIENVRICR